MQVLVLSRYDYEGSSSRYRIYQFLPHLEAAGIRCVVRPFFRPGHLSYRFTHKRTLMIRSIADFWRRAKLLRYADAFDAVFLEKEFMPYMPAYVELGLLPRRCKYICDMDDATFHAYDTHPRAVVRGALGRKISLVIRRAAKVVVGSQYLNDYASRFNMNVELIPTVIDLNKYPERPSAKMSGTPFTIGWIGSQTTTAHVRGLQSVLDEFCRKRKARVVLIGASDGAVGGGNVTTIPWSEKTEVDDMMDFDVGIMPLPDTPVARGKCAFKLIQYMGCWKPVIASPVGENVRVVEQGINGFLAGSGQEWFEALDRLYLDDSLRISMGRSGREKVERHYSLQVTAPRLVEILRETVTGDARAECTNQTRIQEANHSQ